MEKLWRYLIETVFWVQIFLAPLLIACLLAFLIYNSHPELFILSISIVVIGLVLGIVVAERIRKKYGCSRYLSRIISTPDLWPVDDEPINKADK